MNNIKDSARSFFIPLLLAACLGAAASAAAGVDGRYLRVEFPARLSTVPDNRTLSLYEIEVLSGGRNIAWQAKACQSSGTGAALVVDGNANTASKSDKEIDPWIEIDLGQIQHIDKLRLRPAFSETPDFGALAVILDAERKVVWYQRYPLIATSPGVMRPVIETAPESFVGRYVGLKIPPNQRGWYDVACEQANERQITLEKASFPPLADAEKRRALFEQRETPAAVEELCRRFYAMIDPETPGMEQVKAHFTRGEYREALDAYRDSFFNRPEERRFSTFTQSPKFSEFFGGLKVGFPNTSFQRVEPVIVELLLHHQRLWGRENGLAACDLGAPGTTRWTPPEPAPGETTPKTELDLFRTCKHQHGPYFFLYDDLLAAYSNTGRNECLMLWMDYLDDWTMFGRQDIYNFSGNLEMGSEFTPSRMCGCLSILQEIAGKRPELVKQLRSTTFVRYLMALVEDLPPYLIRARRAELANWGCGGTRDLSVLSLLLPEFRCMRYFGREALRLAMSSYIQARSLDGDLIEAGDGGHRSSDLFMMTVFDLLPYLPVSSPSADPLLMRYLRDLKNIYYRNLLTDGSPAGYFRPCWLPNEEMRVDWRATNYVGPRDYFNRVWLHVLHWASQEPWEWLRTQEPEAALRASVMLGEAHPGGPSRLSDPLPYGGVYWLRDSWEDAAECFLLRNHRARTQQYPVTVDTGGGNELSGCGAMRYDLMKDSRNLLNADGIAIDQKPSNSWHDAIYTGGKTEVCAMAERNVIETRFHTSSRFDLAEVQNSYPYSRPKQKFYRKPWYETWEPQPEIDNTPITGVTSHRTAFHLRGEGVWIVADRIENPHPRSFDYAQLWTFPALVNSKPYRQEVQRLSEAGYSLIEEDAQRRRIRTANIGFANVSTYFFGHDFELVQDIDAKGNYLPTAKAKSQLEVIRAAGDEIPKLEHSLRKSGIHWQGQGNQALVALHYTRGPIAEPEKQFANDLAEIEELKSKDGRATGCRAVTKTGTKVWFQSGCESANTLESGPAKARGESLLAMEKGGELSGMALGTDKTITLRGKSYQTQTADFEYALSKTGKFTVTPIYRAIDTVQISPAQNVFTDSVKVSFAIPTQETRDIDFRYTLDGSDPSLQSSLYTEPLTITKDTYVKVRPFRKGLKETPFNIPSEEAGKTVGAIFRKEQPRPSLPVTATKPGLAYEYYEGPWPILFTDIGVPGLLEAKSRGEASGLLNAKEVEATRTTDKAYAIKYEGYVQMPETGVYSFYAPEHLYTPTMDAGYDLRVWIDGQEWFPSPTLHSENVWNIALAAGLHRLEVAYVDYRWKQFKDEYWMNWQAEEMWQGVPMLEFSGPGMEKQALPASRLCHVGAGAIEQGQAKPGTHR